MVNNLKNLKSIEILIRLSIKFLLGHSCSYSHGTCSKQINFNNITHMPVDLMVSGLNSISYGP
jgi:hypothetical protein